MINNIFVAFAMLISSFVVANTSDRKISEELMHENVKFYVQIGASPIPIDRSEYARSIGYPTTSVSVLKDNGCYKYVIGEFDYFEEALELCDSFIKSDGLDSLHIVASMDDEYIELGELPISCLEREKNSVEPKLDCQNEIVYHVQIFASTNPLLTNQKLKSIFALKEELYIDEDMGVKKYMLTSQSEIEQARASLQRIRENGIPSAFIVAYQDGVRISFNSNSL
jgi:hypothetical protein